MNQASPNRAISGQSNPSHAAVMVENLSHWFGPIHALDNVSLCIPSGTVFGLLGLNGAGKTTLIRYLLGLHRSRADQVQLLGGPPHGGNPVIDRQRVMRRVGYMSEEDTLPSWLTVGEMLRFFAAIYPTWDIGYEKELCDWFELRHQSKLSSLSKGGRARVALIAAIAHRPELLILDEPGSGLDPIARDDILAAIVRTVSMEGRTVILSSHLLDEVQRVCDDVAILHCGKLVESLSMSDMDDRYCEWILRSRERESVPSCPLPHAIDWKGSDGEWSAVVDQQHKTEINQWLERQPDWQLLETRPITLNRLFAARVRGNA